jgi:serine-type D-Ala-D-Ala carboxypeptidase (penicillin-binding protein 5/6)
LTIRFRVAPLALFLPLLILTSSLAPRMAGAAVPIPKPPSVDARGYILIDNGSGRVLADLNADQRMEPASITKLMTAYGVFKALTEKRLQLTDMVPISEHAWKAEGSRTFVQVGTSVPAEVLIKGMIVQSGNDATIALAEKVAGTEDAFVQLMNEYAKQLGMRNSHFMNSSGLPDPQHYSSARDIATLSRAIIREFPDYYKWYSLREFIWNNIKQQNRNGLLERDPTVDGIKTGHTDSAGYCLVSSAKRDDMRLISVVLGSASMKAREDASAALLNYGYTFYETLHLRKSGEVVLKPRVYKGNTEFVGVVPRQDVNVTVGRGAGSAIHTAASVKGPLIAPLSANAAVGELTISDGAEVLARIPLYPQQTVAEGSWWTRVSDTVSLWFN